MFGDKARFLWAVHTLRSPQADYVWVVRSQIYRPYPDHHILAIRNDQI